MEKKTITNIETIKKSMEKAKEQIDQELGRVSGVFMSQDDTRAGDIVMPTEELMKASDLIQKHLLSSHLALIEKMIEREEGEIKPDDRTSDWGHTYNQGKRDGHDEAKANTINHLKSLREEIKKISKN